MTVEFGLFVATARDFLLDPGSKALDTIPDPSAGLGAGAGAGLVASFPTSSPISNLHETLGGDGSLSVMIDRPLNTHPFLF